MNYKKYEVRYKELFTLFADFDKKCREITNIDIKVKNEVFQYLLYKAFNTFLSIRALVEMFQLDDAFCLYRILLENVINFIYLYKNQDKIVDYKSSEMQIFKEVFYIISQKTEHMKLPEKLSILIDEKIMEEYITASKVAKVFRKIYNKDNWTSLSFAEKAESVGKGKLYIEYKNTSSLIHSNWFGHRGLDDQIHIDDFISSLVVSSCNTILYLMYTLNEMFSNRIELTIVECEKLFLEINKILCRNENNCIKTK